MRKAKKQFTIFGFIAVLIITVGISITALNSSHHQIINQAEFTIPYPVLKMALQADIDSQNQSVKICWIDVLAYLGAKYNGDFSKYQQQESDRLISALQSGEKIELITKDMDDYYYYREVYGAVLDGFVGEYETSETDEHGNTYKVTKYGLKVYSPLPADFPFEHYDDFGAERTYGYVRKHLGHDLICAAGTPVVAVEEGTVEALGWNRYGGWRIGIRSFDKKRYYYYAHLQKDHPYQSGLKIGSIVSAGEVIGYTGQTGYSETENESNIKIPHLHLGMELIFDESQKDSENEIWIDLYSLTELLEGNKNEVIRNPETKEFHSVIG